MGGEPPPSGAGRAPEEEPPAPQVSRLRGRQVETRHCNRREFQQGTTTLDSTPATLRSFTAVPSFDRSLLQKSFTHTQSPFSSETCQIKNLHNVCLEHCALTDEASFVKKPYTNRAVFRKRVAK